MSREPFVPSVNSVCTTWAYAINGLDKDDFEKYTFGGGRLFKIAEQFRPEICKLLSLSDTTDWKTICAQAGISSEDTEENRKKWRISDNIKLPEDLHPLFEELELIRFTITGRV